MGFNATSDSAPLLCNTVDHNSFHSLTGSHSRISRCRSEPAQPRRPKLLWHPLFGRTRCNYQSLISFNGPSTKIPSSVQGRGTSESYCKPSSFYTIHLDFQWAHRLLGVLDFEPSLPPRGANLPYYEAREYQSVKIGEELHRSPKPIRAFMNATSLAVRISY